jgi:hypothetical protein
MQLNATVIDSSIYHDIFSSTAVRAVWSDQARVQRYLDVEKRCPWWRDDWVSFHPRPPKKSEGTATFPKWISSE